MECQKQFRVCFDFASALSDWSAKLAPPFQPMKHNQSQSRLARMRFPALDAGYMNLLRILIGLFHCLRLL